MIASSPADGRVSVDELAQLAGPDFIIVLSSAEKAALETVWRFMKAAPTTTVAPIELRAGMEPFTMAGSVRFERPEPTTIVRPAERTRFEITEIGPTLGWQSQEDAHRIQYGF